MELNIRNKEMFSTNRAECWVLERQSQLSDGSAPHSGPSPADACRHRGVREPSDGVLWHNSCALSPW